LRSARTLGGVDVLVDALRIDREVRVAARRRKGRERALRAAALGGVVHDLERAAHVRTA
jgi:hypothetical protein